LVGDDFWPSYGPLTKKVFFFCVLPDTQKLARTTFQKLLVQFHPNFVHIIGFIWFNEFCQRYGSLIYFYFLKFIRTTSHIPLMQFQ
jgi:hypothetical protein